MHCFSCGKDIAKHRRFCSSCDIAAGLEPPSKMKERGRTDPQHKKKSTGGHSLASLERAAAKKTQYRPAEHLDESTFASSHGRTKLVGWLVSFTKDPAGYDIQLREGRSILGSDAHCDIYIHNDRSISAKHAIIMCRDGVVYVRDNDSTNGTYVNGSDIFGKGSVELNNRAELRFGDSIFTLCLI